jgi:hypothetical protein
MRSFITAFRICLLLAFIATCYLAFWPVPIDPKMHAPTIKVELTGVLTPNNKLSKAEKIGPLTSASPISIAFDKTGWLYTGVENGDILRMRPDGSEMTVFAKVEKQPSALYFDLDENLIVALIRGGFISIDKSGTITHLLSSAEGVPFQFEGGGIAQNSEGVMYFIDSFSKFGDIPPFEAYAYEIMESSSSGRLIEYNPKSKKIRVLLNNLLFPTGLCISPDKSFLLINQCTGGNILRYWLKGSLAGKTEIFVSLPGYSDLSSVDKNGIYWICMNAPRFEGFENLAERPFIRKVIMRLPGSWNMIPFPPEGGAFILGVNDKGEFVYNFGGAGSEMPNFTSVVEHEGYLYIGNLGSSEFIYRVKI